MSEPLTKKYAPIFLANVYEYCKARMIEFAPSPNPHFTVEQHRKNEQRHEYFRSLLRMCTYQEPGDTPEDFEWEKLKFLAVKDVVKPEEITDKATKGYVCELLGLPPHSKKSVNSIADAEMRKRVATILEACERKLTGKRYCQFLDNKEICVPPYFGLSASSPRCYVDVYRVYPGARKKIQDEKSRIYKKFSS